MSDKGLNIPKKHFLAIIYFDSYKYKHLGDSLALDLISELKSVDGIEDAKVLNKESIQSDSRIDLLLKVSKLLSLNEVYSVKESLSAKIHSGNDAITKSQFYYSGRLLLFDSHGQGPFEESQEIEAKNYITLEVLAEKSDEAAVKGKLLEEVVKRHFGPIMPGYKILSRDKKSLLISLRKIPGDSLSGLLGAIEGAYEKMKADGLARDTLGLHNAKVRLDYSGVLALDS